MNLLRKIVGMALLLLLPLGVKAQYPSVAERELTVAERNAQQGLNDTIDRLADDFVHVSLCVADPTDKSQDYLGMTGHVFLRLQSPTFDLDYCISYETERIKGQIWDYITGNLKMRMVSAPTDEYVEDYRIWQRAVHEYRIQMPPDAELRLWEQLDARSLKEQELQIDLFKFGCANSLLRYVEKALSPTVIVYDWPEKYLTKSAMEIAEDHLECYPWTCLGLRLIAGRKMAQLTTPKEKVVFPMELLEVWSSATINGQPMLAYIGDVVEAEPIVEKMPWFTPQLCGILLLLLAAGGVVMAFIRKHQKNK